MPCAPPIFSQRSLHSSSVFSLLWHLRLPLPLDCALLPVWPSTQFARGRGSWSGDVPPTLTESILRRLAEGKQKEVSLVGGATQQSPLGWLFWPWKSGAGGQMRPGVSCLSWHAPKPERPRGGAPFCRVVFFWPLQHRCSSCRGCEGLTGPRHWPPLWNRISVLF